MISVLATIMAEFLYLIVIPLRSRIPNISCSLSVA